MPCQIGQDQIAAVVVAGKTDNLGQNRGAPFLGGLVFLEQDGAAALADHQAVAFFVKRPGGAFGAVVVADRAGQQIVEHRHRGGVVLVGAAAEHGVLHAVLDHLVAEADGLTAGGAGGGGGDHPAGDAEHPGDVDGGGVDHGAEIIDRADGGKFRFQVLEKGLVDLALHRGAAVGGTKGHPEPSRS